MVSQVRGRRDATAMDMFSGELGEALRGAVVALRDESRQNGSARVHGFGGALQVRGPGPSSSAEVGWTVQVAKST